MFSVLRQMIHNVNVKSQMISDASGLTAVLLKEEERKEQIEIQNDADNNIAQFLICVGIGTAISEFTDVQRSTAYTLLPKKRFRTQLIKNISELYDREYLSDSEILVGPAGLECAISTREERVKQLRFKNIKAYNEQSVEHKLIVCIGNELLDSSPVRKKIAYSILASKKQLKPYVATAFGFKYDADITLW